jgi:hypothetical protein
MIDTFDQLARNTKHYLDNGKKGLGYDNITKYQEIENDDDDLISNLSTDLENKVKIVYINNSTKIKTSSFLDLKYTPIIYFVVNISLYSILFFLGVQKGKHILTELDIFNLYKVNIIIFNIYHIVSLFLGSLVVVILYNQFKEKLSIETGYKDNVSLDFVIFFGFLMLLFNFTECLMSMSSCKI